MYLESIEALHEKETALKRTKEESALLAKKEIADARADGEALLRSAAEKAEAEVKQMMREVNDRALAAAGERAETAKNKRAVLLSRAERNKEKAAALIVERIVNG